MTKPFVTMIPAARALAVIALLVLPGTGLGALVHFTVVEHTVCVEHGALTHPEGHARPGVTPDNSFTAGSNSAKTHPHQHCSVVSTAQPEGTLFVPAVAPDASVCSQPRVSSSVFSSCVALLRLAPKNSPPA